MGSAPPAGWGRKLVDGPTPIATFLPCFRGRFRTATRWHSRATRSGTLQTRPNAMTSESSPSRGLIGDLRARRDAGGPQTISEKLYARRHAAERAH